MKFLCFQVSTSKEEVTKICKSTYFDHSLIDVEFEILPISDIYSRKQINKDLPVFHYPYQDEKDLIKLINEVKLKLNKLGYYNTSNIPISVINCNNLGIYKTQAV
jgi:hypothetical protein